MFLDGADHLLSIRFFAGIQNSACCQINKQPMRNYLHTTEMGLHLSMDLHLG
ncbi:hypothetical protein ZEAMMB73_Zm00001d045548 [Zea mays]|uniref:Uncharacterized protein n=1 Tax=Zea mays TaxID=4577 RepID=A0A1D6NWQ1_MAIZE|nr:hypothetical protein ZEAMMB73_Zm00001d045548 [Zea mays]